LLPRKFEREKNDLDAAGSKGEHKKNVSAMAEIKRKDMLPMGQGWILFAVTISDRKNVCGG
jgi:hypothetical protein